MPGGEWSRAHPEGFIIAKEEGELRLGGLGIADRDRERFVQTDVNPSPPTKVYVVGQWSGLVSLKCTIEPYRRASLERGR